MIVVLLSTPNLNYGALKHTGDRKTAWECDYLIAALGPSDDLAYW